MNQFVLFILLILCVFVARAHGGQIQEHNFSYFQSRFPGSEKDLFSPQEEPRIPPGRHGNAIISELRSKIYEKAEMPNLPNNQTYLVVGGAWVMFDVPLVVLDKYLGTVTHQVYPAPVTNTQNIQTVDQEHQAYTAFLKNGLAGITLEQKCEALLSSRALADDPYRATSEHVYQFFNCHDVSTPQNLWVHESWNRDFLIEREYEGRKVTLFLFQNYTMIERHKVAVMKPTKGMLHHIAVSSAKEGFTTLISDVTPQK